MANQKLVLNIFLTRILYLRYFYTTYGNFWDDSAVDGGVAATPKKSKKWNFVSWLKMTPNYVKHGLVQQKIFDPKFPNRLRNIEYF